MRVMIDTDGWKYDCGKQELLMKADYYLIYYRSSIPSHEDPRFTGLDKTFLHNNLLI
jgi:hypothetical protein